MRFMKKSCFIMQKITVLSILWIFLIVLIGCDKKQLNEEEHVHTKVHVLKIDPTCISEGRLEYWYCSQCNKVYRDRDVKYEISWEDTKLPKTEHIIEETAGVSATCEASGITVGRHCSYCNEIISEQEEILPLGHDYNYEQATWEWQGFAGAKMIASCKNDASHKEIYSANITSETTEATCEESGKTVYVASVFVEDKEYTNQKEDIILPLEHDFDLEHIEWDWDEESNAIAQIPCKHDAEHIEKYKASVKEEIVPATCTTDGKRIFTATIVIEGQTYSDIKEIGIDSIGHTFNYDNINWVWEDYRAATATVYCKNDQSHQASYDATITSQTDAPTCTKEGKKTYIATITIDGKSFTDSKDETLSPLKHDFDYNSYAWEWTGYTQATIHFACKYDSAHLDSYVGQVQSYIEPATCVQQGKIVYTANVKIHDTSYSDEKEEILPIDETAHDYNYAQPIWNWTAIVNGYTVSAEVTCKCGESFLEFENATLFVDSTPATFEAPGLKKYTASVEIDGEHYFDTKIEELPIKQYVSSESEFLSAIEADAYDLTLTEDIVFTQEVHLTGRYAFLNLNEYTLFVPDNKFFIEATHSTIANGFLVTEEENRLGSYVLSTDSQANILLNRLITLGGMNLKNANVIIRYSDITATTAYAVSLQEESKAIIESGIFRKHYVSEENSFFYVEPSSEKKEACSLSLEKEIELYTTLDAILFNTMGVAPSYEEEPSIISMDIKDYLSSNLDFKCLSLCEDLAYTENDDEIIIAGKKLFIDLNHHTWTVPSEALRITTSYARITNGTLTLLEEETGNVISIENGCKALIDNITAVGDIKIENSSVTLKNITIHTTIS